MDHLQRADISRISNNEILKNIFSNLNSNRILKIVKNNKNLQKKLGINKEHYNWPKYEYIEEKIILEGDKYEGYFPIIEVCLVTCCTFIFLVYILIYAILLVAKDTFDESNTKENYDKSIENKIKLMNISLFILVVSVIILWFIVVFYVLKNYSKEYGIKKIIKSIILIIIIIIHISFEVLAIFKLVFSYVIKKDGTTWFIVMDYIFLVLNFIHTAFIIFGTITFIKNVGNRIECVTHYFLIYFNNIKIEEFELPKNFRNWNKKERKRYISNDYINFILLNIDNIGINMSLNRVKDKYNIPNFEECDSKYIPSFIVDSPGEMLLYPDRNIYKISNKGYIFQYPTGEFQNIIRRNSDDNVNKILLKDNLNCYQVITLKDKEIIYVFEPSEKEKVLYTFNNDQNRKKKYKSKEALYNNNYFEKIDSEQKTFTE